MPLDFNKHAQKGNKFLQELALELGDKHDLHRAGRILRAVLHTLRNHLPMEENFQLISQLPSVIKGLYIDGWTPGKQHKKTRKKEDFIAEIMREDRAAMVKDFSKTNEVELAMKAVITVLKNHISEGEFKSMTATLPKELKGLLNENLSSKKLTQNHDIVL